MIVYPPVTGVLPADLADQRAMYSIGGDAAEASSHTVAVAVANTAYSSEVLEPGAYEFWLSGGSPADTLVYLGGPNGTPTVPTPDAAGVAALQIGADKIGFFRATSANAYFWVKLIGSIVGTLRLNRIGE